MNRPMLVLVVYTRLLWSKMERVTGSPKLRPTVSQLVSRGLPTTLG